MARRKTQLPGPPWSGRWSDLPWWITGTAGALASYAVLHTVAAPDMAGPATLGHGAGEMASSWRLVGRWGQYVLPLVVLVLCYWQHARHASSKAKVVAGVSEPDAPAGMGWREFEVALFGALAKQGYQQVGSGASRPEVGADRTLRKDRQTVLVRSRHWKAEKVDAAMVQAHCEAMSASGAAGGIIVTSGRFGREAIAYAQMHNVKLIDGPILRGLLKPT